MTPRVWVERPITSMEDAEALPVGSMIFDALGPNAERFVPGGQDWHCDGWPHTLSDACQYARAGSTLYPTALVPVEAEEEHGLELNTRPDTPEGNAHITPAGSREQAEWQRDHNPHVATGRIASRLVTHWEDA